MLPDDVIDRMYPTTLRMFRALEAGRNVRIDTLLRCLANPDPTWPPRVRHQRVGSYIRRINQHVKPYGYEVVPGVPRASYRLQPIA